MGIFKKVFGKKKTEAELKAEVLKKATDHWNNSELTDFQNKDGVNNSDNKNTLSSQQNGVAEKSFTVPKDIDQAKKKNVRTVLLEIADRGETGVLSTSISDKVGINKHETAAALSYLSRNNYVEAVNSTIGMKYYLTAAGRKFCLSKEFNSIS